MSLAILRRSKPIHLAIQRPHIPVQQDLVQKRLNGYGYSQWHWWDQHETETQPFDKIIVVRLDETPFGGILYGIHRLMV